MATAYWIGVFAGVGTALGIVAAGVLASSARGVAAAVVAAAAVAAGIALVLTDWPEAVAAGAGGALGALGAAQLVRGSLRRGGTRGGVAALLVLAAAVVAALAFIPVVGVIEAVVLPALAARARGRAGETHAGLRILARD